MTFCLLILLGMYVFKFDAFANVKRSPFEATSTALLNGMDCKYHGQLYRYTLDVYTWPFHFAISP
jgi:hypothetical protein